MKAYGVRPAKRWLTAETITPWLFRKETLKRPRDAPSRRSQVFSPVHDSVASDGSSKHTSWSKLQVYNNGSDAEKMQNDENHENKTEGCLLYRAVVKSPICQQASAQPRRSSPCITLPGCVAESGQVILIGGSVHPLIQKFSVYLQIQIYIDMHTYIIFWHKSSEPNGERQGVSKGWMEGLGQPVGGWFSCRKLYFLARLRALVQPYCLTLMARRFLCIQDPAPLNFRFAFTGSWVNFAATMTALTPWEQGRPQAG